MAPEVSPFQFNQTYSFTDSLVSFLSVLRGTAGYGPVRQLRQAPGLKGRDRNRLCYRCSSEPAQLRAIKKKHCSCFN